LKLLLCLFTSPEVVTITANLWWIYVLTEPMLANPKQESFQREWNKEPYFLNCPRIY
jgi:hypothetical protein